MVFQLLIFNQVDAAGIEQQVKQLEAVVERIGIRGIGEQAVKHRVFRKGFRSIKKRQQLSQGVDFQGIKGVEFQQFFPADLKVCLQVAEQEDFLFVHFPFFFPGIDLQGDQNPDHHQQDFPNRIQEVPAEPTRRTCRPRRVFREELLSDQAEKTKHEFGMIAGLKYKKERSAQARPGEPGRERILSWNHTAKIKKFLNPFSLR